MEIYPDAEPHTSKIAVHSIEDAEQLTVAAIGIKNKLSAWGLVSRAVMATKCDSFPLSFSVEDHKLPAMAERMEKAAEKKSHEDPAALAASAFAIRRYVKDPGWDWEKER